MVDHRVSKEAQRYWDKQGLDIKLRREGGACDANGTAVKVTYADAQGEHTLTVDKLVVAVGRPGLSRRVYLAEGTGVTLDARRLRRGGRALPHAEAPNVWAVGDVVRGPMLAHKGEGEGVRWLISSRAAMAMSITK